MTGIHSTHGALAEALIRDHFREFGEHVVVSGADTPIAPSMPDHSAIRALAALPAASRRPTAADVQRRAEAIFFYPEEVTP